MPPRKLNISHPTYYINRELGNLAFQWRVFAEAHSASAPLLERVKFLAIVDNNLDEFFMVRVGGLTMQKNANVTALSIDGRTPAEQLAAIRKESLRLMKALRETYHNELLPSLQQAGIHLLNYQDLKPQQREQLDTYFREVIFPVLTPLAFDPSHPFPHISNLSLNLAVSIRDPQGELHFARVKVPNTLARLVPVKRSSGAVRRDGTVPHNHYFVWLEQVIQANLDSLFPGMKVIEAYPFRVIRNADLAIQELEASDLLESMEENLRRRRFGDVVQLAVHASMPKDMLDLLARNFRMDPNAIYILDAPLGLNDLMELQRIERFDLKMPPFIPRIPETLRLKGKDESIFNVIQRQDILLHHPYDSFAPVVGFIRSAARDPDVLTIKQTLYRVGRNSPIVRALLEARRDHGKQVAVLVELKARFDEESNIEWARSLEREGVHVTYGLLGLKTHSKVTLVVRKEGDAIRRYLHLGTGNYNHVTAKQYEDFGLLTCNPEIGADATDLFNYLTGYSAQSHYRQLLVAPINLREQLTERIEREIQLHKKHRNGHIIFKVNALVDKPIIRQLYEASQSGVKIDLLVRSICSLRPAVPGLSENIRVISVVGRFLEHSRIYYFHNNKNPEIFLGSADLMPRNLNDRVEVLFPILDPQIAKKIRDEILEVYLSDTVSAYTMKTDGSYSRSGRAEDRLRKESSANARRQPKSLSAQDRFMQNVRQLDPESQLDL